MKHLDRFEALIPKMSFAVYFFYMLSQIIGFRFDSATLPSLLEQREVVPGKLADVSLGAFILCVAFCLILRRKEIFSKLVWALVGLASLSRIVAFAVQQGEVLSLYEKRLWFGGECFTMALLSLVLLCYGRKLLRPQC